MALLEINGVCRLTRNPEIRFLPGSETAIAQFAVACSEKYKDKEKTAYYDCKAWGKLAEICGKYLTKGSKVFIRGKLEQETWEDKDSGKMRSKHIIRIDKLEFCESKRQDGGQNAFDEPSGGFSDEDIPFMAYEKFLI